MGENTARGQAQIIETIFAAIIAIVIGVALAAAPSELQPAGVLIIILGVVIFVALIYAIISGGGGV